MTACFFTNAANIITVIAIQLYFKLQSHTSPNLGPGLSSQIPRIRNPNILANFAMLGGGTIHLLKMLRGDFDTSKYSLHLSAAVGVRTGGNRPGVSCSFPRFLYGCFLPS